MFYSLCEIIWSYIRQFVLNFSNRSLNLIYERIVAKGYRFWKSFFTLLNHYRVRLTSALLLTRGVRTLLKFLFCSVIFRGINVARLMTSLIRIRNLTCKWWFSFCSSTCLTFLTIKALQARIKTIMHARFIREVVFASSASEWVLMHDATGMFHFVQRRQIHFCYSVQLRIFVALRRPNILKDWAKGRKPEMMIWITWIGLLLLRTPTHI